MSAQPKVAIFAAEGLQLEALLEVWEQSPLSDVEMVLLGVADNAGATAMFAGRPLGFQAIDEYDLSSLQLLVVLESALVVEAYRQQLSALSCPVLGYYAALKVLDAELLVDQMPATRVAGLPQIPVQALKTVLGKAGVEALDITLFYPAALYGQAGVQELAAQTARLLNAQSVEHSVFHKQLPFNYFPLADTQLGRELEADVLVDAQKVFADAEVHVRAVQMPVFHGVGMAVSVVLSDEVQLDEWLGIWQDNDMIAFQTGAQELSNLDVLQKDALLSLGDVRKSVEDDYRIDFWIGFDEARFGVVQNLISVAEFLLKHHL